MIGVQCQLMICRGHIRVIFPWLTVLCENWHFSPILDFVFILAAISKGQKCVRRSNLIYMSAGKYRGPKSSNRIKLSWFVQVLSHFYWFVVLTWSLSSPYHPCCPHIIPTLSPSSPCHPHTPYTPHLYPVVPMLSSWSLWSPHCPCHPHVVPIIPMSSPHHPLVVPTSFLYPHLPPLPLRDPQNQ